MHGLQKKKTLKKLLYSKTMLLILLVALGFAARATWSIYAKERESQQNASVAKSELENLKTRESILGKEIDHLSTPQGIEGELREKYTITQKGEELYVIVPPKKDDSTATSDNANQSWWEKFMGLFQKKP